MKTNNIEDEIKNAFGLLGDIDLLPDQKSDILHHAELIHARKIKLYTYRKLALICALGAAAACVAIFLLFPIPSKIKDNSALNNFGCVDMEISGQKRLVMKDGEFHIIYDYDHKWDPSIEATLAAMRALKYFYDEEEIYMVYHIPYREKSPSLQNSRQKTSQ